jgi:protein-S-isoprenylcysteine O-methyltransferase Ste14
MIARNDSPVASTETSPKADRRRGIARWAGQMVAALVIFGAILFLAAGRLNWAVGWAYLGLNAFTQILSAIVLVRRQGEMLAERSQVRTGTKSWDRILAPAIVIAGTLAVLITAGLDTRFGWSGSIGAGLWSAGFIIAFLSQVFVLWAMASNPFFALTVRIQNDRGQTVISSGPYRLIRHPGYAGSVIYNLVIPLALGSWWTFIPAVLTAGLIIVRTGLEDRTLQAELPDYRTYAAQVGFRLLPGIW